MPWLSFAVVIACLCQWLMTVPNTRRSIKQSRLLDSFFSSLREAFPDLRQLGRALVLGILGVGASQINNAIDTLYARYADAEGPALLWYAIRIQQLPLALFGIAIAGAILPPLSRSIKAGRHAEFRHFLQDAFTQTWTFMLPLSAALFVMGDMSVMFLYGRGDFGSQSVIQTTYCLWAYGIGLLPSALVLILAPAFYAQSNYRLPALVSFGAMLLNLFLNTLFIMGFGWNAMSVAIATSISAWVNFIVLTWRLKETISPLISARMVKQSIAITLATLFATWGTYEVRVHLLQLPLFSPSLFTASFLETSISLGCQVFTFGALFFLVYLIFIQDRQKLQA